MNTERALEMLEAHREYAEKTKNFHNKGNFNDLANFIKSMQLEIDADNRNLADMTKLLQKCSCRFN
jgi:hypothetical protein